MVGVNVTDSGIDDWCVKGCGVDGLGLRNCLAGRLDMFALMRLPAAILTEVSCEMLVWRL